MRDYTCCGIPIAQLSTAHIEACLRDGIWIRDAGHLSVEAARLAVIKRLELELLIRSQNLRA